MTPELHNLLCATRNFIDAHDAGLIENTFDCMLVDKLSSATGDFENTGNNIFDAPKEVRNLLVIIRKLFRQIGQTDCSRLCTIPKRSIIVEELRRQLLISTFLIDQLEPA